MSDFRISYIASATIVQRAGNDVRKSELEKEGQESKISLPCKAVLTSLSVFLSGLLPLLLFSAKKLA